MTTSRLPLVGSVLLFLGLSIGFSFTDEPPTPPPVKEDLSEAAFNTMMQVVAHKRCMNCHPSGDRPHQGEDSHIHRFDVQRGPEGHGTVAMQCGTCHQEENNLLSGVPGAPHWHLAPQSMGWEGLSKEEIAQSIMDPKRNGGRNPEEILHHMTEDPLVLWVFEPGINHEGIPREKPPVSKEEYIEAVKTWIEAGAEIPSN
ncbi:MAG: hypothetical protein AAF694_02280 [Bacteroidota bacterium]